MPEIVPGVEDSYSRQAITGGGRYDSELSSLLEYGTDYGADVYDRGTQDDLWAGRN